jgi:hypothetical protein
MKASEIVNIRLANQQLTGTKLTCGREMVEWFAAIQGQEYTQTKWGIGLRLPESTDADIESELTSGNILRTHLLRPTWHFVSANDIRWLLWLTAPRVKAASSFMCRKLELDEPLFHRCNNMISNLLRGNKQLTRNEINEKLKQQKIVVDGVRLSYIMMNAELDGIICSGARRGKQFTYAMMEERTPKSRITGKEEALAELARRYFTSRGPATIKDFATWSGLTLAECRTGLNEVKKLFEEKNVDGEFYYFRPVGPTSDIRSETVYLLPPYDELFMGYKNREVFFQYKNSIFPAPKMSFDCAIMYRGQVTGTWKRTIKKKSIDLAYHFFLKPDKHQWKEFQNNINRFETFNRLGVQLYCIE